MRESRLEEILLRMRDGQGSESHIQLEMNRIKQQVRDDKESTSSTHEVFEDLNDIDINHPIVPALEGLVRWEANQDYHNGAVPALDAYRDAVDEAVSDRWPNVAVHAAQQAALVAADINDDKELDFWIPRIVELFDQHWEELTPNTQGNLIDAFPRLQYFADGKILDEFENVLESAATASHEKEEYGVERRFLNALLDIRRKRDQDVTVQEQLLIESYNAEAEATENRGQMHRAIVFQRALDNCTEFADEEQVVEWKRELRSANRTAIDEEMASIEHKPNKEEIEELEQFIDEIVDQARQASQNDFGGAALMFLLSRNDFVPRLEELRTMDERVSIMDLVGRRNMTKEGDAIPDPEDRTRPHGYQASVQLRDAIVTSILFRVFDENIITEGDLYLYLWAIDELTVHDVAYLTDFIVAVFDNRYADALHIGVPRLEGAIASILKDRGFETASLQDGYTTPVPLPGLLNMLDGKVDENLVEYLRFRYSDISGQRVRNQVAHGRAEYKLAAPQMCLILLYDIFRSISWIEHNL
ncbi:hypothetical protein [Halalkalicoccus subterraneus]|uniref:hypothetical protein n=1 Tax=Halalkalicoccus subterraneus TaxID=2675002 RepID=UPI000EFD3E65|nr:hypothetical protein [Halalkalicoccus subterraneus]